MLQWAEKSFLLQRGVRYELGESRALRDFGVSVALVGNAPRVALHPPQSGMAILAIGFPA